MDKYILKQQKIGAIARPFPQPPFSDRLGVSLLSTHPKKDTIECRVIMDLSWPPGRSVNDGIAKNQFMGFNDKLTFPTVDLIARRVAEFSCSEVLLLFKIDPSGYFRQLPLYPGDYSLLCFTWNNMIYFLVLPMGLCSAPYFAQRVSNAIKYIHNKMGYFLFNYMDDFIGVEVVSKISDSFGALHHTLRNIGITEAKEKRVASTQKLNCVGDTGKY